MYHVLSHTDVAYIRVFWEEEEDSHHPFNRLLQSCWRYCLGDEQAVIPSVPRSLFIKVYFLTLRRNHSVARVRTRQTRRVLCHFGSADFQCGTGGQCSTGSHRCTPAHCLSLRSASRILARLPDCADTSFFLFCTVDLCKMSLVACYHLG